MTTAFQPNAFQNNAFQIDSNAYTFGGVWLHRHARKRARKLAEQYEELARKLPDNQLLIAAVDAYVSPQTKDEVARRSKAQYLADRAYRLDRIAWRTMVEHAAAVERFERLMQQLYRVLEEQEDDDLIVLLLLS